MPGSSLGRVWEQPLEKRKRKGRGELRARIGVHLTAEAHQPSLQVRQVVLGEPREARPQKYHSETSGKAAGRDCCSLASLGGSFILPQRTSQLASQYLLYG